MLIVASRGLAYTGGDNEVVTGHPFLVRDLMRNQAQADRDESQDSEAESHSQHSLLIVSLDGEVGHLVALGKKWIRNLD